MLTIYRASAGSGKTYTLAKRYIELLFDSRLPQAHRRILAVTFTHKATNEMKSRILQSLNDLATGAKSDYRAGLMGRCKLSAELVNQKAEDILTDILQDYSAFAVSTIDSFFQQIIRAFAHEIGLPGSYNVELDSEEVLTTAVDNLFFELDKNSTLLKQLQQFTEDNIADGKKWNPHDDMVMLGKELFKEECQSQMGNLNEALQNKDFLKIYTGNIRQIKQDYETQVRALATKALQQIASAGLTTESFKGGARSGMKWLEKMRDGIFGMPSNTFLAMAEAVENCYTKTSPNIAAIEQLYTDGLQEILQQITGQLGKPYMRYCTAETIRKNLNTLGILSDISMEIRRQNTEQNRMPISDTNLLLQKVIDGSDAPFVYEKTGVNVRHFMIDEFQDTSAMQWHNFRPLVAESVANRNANLVVGDVKQSIYRWRNSDWKLLDEQVQHDILGSDEETLKGNWRSGKMLVEFNNRFFKQAAQTMQQALNDEMGDVTAKRELQPLCEKITHAYEGLEQQPQKKTEGFVQVQFVEVPEGSKFDTETLNRLPALLDDLQQRGIPFGKVAFLVRTIADAQALTKFLVEKHYKVVSNEGLLVASAGSVRFLVGMLRLFAQPDDAVERTVVNYEYAVGRLRQSRSKALDKAASAKGEMLFSQKEQEAVQRIQHLSLFDKTEELTATFAVGEWNGESAYVQAFLDVVYNFSVTRTSDLNTFLTWWEKQSLKKTIPTPEMPDALQIMTIHKSKGLEFEVVIIPFCDWKMPIDGTKRNILWCAPREEPFKQLPLVPVSATKDLANTLFANDYYQELMHTYIDNLNLLYVAFTRPRNELYVFAPKPRKEIVEKPADTASLLYMCFAGSDWQLTHNTLTLGTPTEPQELLLPPKAAEPLPYISVDLGNRLCLRRLSSDYWMHKAGIAESRLNLGVLMHEFLCGICRKSDQETALAAMISAGRINEAEAGLMRTEMEKLWALPQVDEWFSGRYKVLNEAAILKPDGTSYRPDRIMFSADGEAFIVDYKFGDVRRKNYENQVRTYMNLLSQMGYRTRGYLCYVELAIIEEIK